MKTRSSILAVLLTVGIADAAAETLDGVVQWHRRLELGTPATGVVREVTVAPGDRVEAGQTLARLDQHALQAAVQAARAAVEHARLLRDEAQREFDRTQELYDRTLLATHDLEVARIDRAAADERLAAVEARQAAAEQELAYSSVRAPFAAVVLERRAQAGQVVVNRLRAEPLFVIAAAGHMLARVEVDAQRAAVLQVGQAARVQLGADGITGRIERIGLDPLPDSGAYPVDVLFATDPPAGVRAGQSVGVELP